MAKRSIDWSSVDWDLPNSVIAGALKCDIRSVKAQREKRQENKFYTRTSPLISLRFEDPVYDALEFIGAMAKNYKAPMYVGDVVRQIVTRYVVSLGKTYPDLSGALEKFRESEIAGEANNFFDAVESAAEDLTAQQRRGGDIAFSINLDDQLKHVGLDRKHRAAYRAYASLKRCKNTKVYQFGIVATMRGRQEPVSIYLGAKTWTEKAEVLFISKDNLPLILGTDLDKDENALLTGLSEKASPHDVFHALFKDMDTIDRYQPRVLAGSINESACEEEAYRRYRVYGRA